MLRPYLYYFFIAISYIWFSNWEYFKSKSVSWKISTYIILMYFKCFWQNCFLVLYISVPNSTLLYSLYVFCLEMEIFSFVVEQVFFIKKIIKCWQNTQMSIVNFHIIPNFCFSYLITRFKVLLIFHRLYNNFNTLLPLKMSMSSSSPSNHSNNCHLKSFWI